MTRSIYSPLADKRSLTGIVPVALGGTGGITKEAATVNLSLIPHSQKGAANGILGLDSSGKYDGSNLGTMVDGPAMLYTGTSGTYKITDYHFTKSYNVSAVLGNAVINHDTITYTPGAVAGSGGFTVNGVTYTVTVNTPIVATPSIVSPVNNAINMLESVTLTSNAFSTLGANDIHSSSSWQVATDSAFNTIVASITDSTTALTAWVATGLLEATTYFVRCRHKGAVLGNSNWSITSTFTTKVSFTPSAEFAIITANDGMNYDRFGNSSCISGDGNTIVIGADGHDYDGWTDAGTAYVFVKSGSTWTEQAKLRPSDIQSGMMFIAMSISDDGNTIVIGANGKTLSGLAYCGQAYIYVRSGTTWTEQAKLSASDKTAYDQFGYAVGISGDGNTVIVSAQYKSSGGFNQAGQAYVFVRSGVTWSQQAIIAPITKFTNDLFGTSISLSNNGNTAVIGAYQINDSSGNLDTGGAYVFTRSGTVWTEKILLLASNRVAYDSIGRSVAISSDGNTIIIGASNKSSNKGAAYIFTLNAGTWSQQTILTASDGATGDSFGNFVTLSLDGNTAVIGAYSKIVGGLTEAGQAYIFKRSGSTWSEKNKLIASDKAASNQFGYTVDITNDGMTVLITAAGRLLKGAGYIFV